MPQARKSPSSNPDELAELLAAIGEDHFDIRQLGSVRIELQHIAAVYAVHVNGPRLPPTMARKLLRKFRANTAKRLELRRQLRSIRREILVAAWIQNSSDVDEDFSRQILAGSSVLPGQIDHAKIEADEDRRIQDYLDRASDYRKRAVRKFVVEPFLSFLGRHGVKPSRERPLIRMLTALFDWIGVEKKFRPTPAGIRTILKEFKRGGR